MAADFADDAGFSGVVFPSDLGTTASRSIVLESFSELSMIAATDEVSVVGNWDTGDRVDLILKAERIVLKGPKGEITRHYIETGNLGSMSDYAVAVSYHADQV